MKVSKLFSRALALLNEDESRAKAFKRNALPLINQLLAQCLSTENALRESKGEAALERADEAESFDDNILYDEKFVSECLPYALASLLCADDDRSMSNAMGEQFETLRAKYNVVNTEAVEDYYA